jgi:GT2 family glycosyltransferase
METAAPPVVAVVVAHDPGPWFEESLQALAEQDYPELSVLVLDAASQEDLTLRVASVLPDAFVRRLPVDRGFAASANEVLGMVEGASHFLFCHDDVAPDPGAVRILVEEAFRSNAGVVAPKFVRWEDPTALLHVGMAVDKGGAVVDRVEPGEIDHGQHDGVRDVFLAPGGCMLVRADLFAALGGFDAAILALGEDLDLCWRAQVAGARVVVAPAARVRHLEMLASGRRPLSSTPDRSLAHVADERRHARRVRRTGAAWRPISLQALQRRHELRVVLKCYSPFHLARVLPQMALLALAECLIAVVSGHYTRARAVAHAWRWNLGRLDEIHAARVALSSQRQLEDAAVRRLQLHGSARLNAYVRRAVTVGLHVAHLGEDVTREVLAAAPGEPSSAHAVPPVALAGEETARAHHDTRFEELPAAVAAVGDPVSTRVIVWGILGVLLVVGSRAFLGGGFPVMVQLLALPPFTTLLRVFEEGWRVLPAGRAIVASPAVAILGVAGMLLGAGLVQKVMILGCVPVGLFGLARLVRPIGSLRARVLAVVVYAVLPLPYAALAAGRWDALLAYAGTPWLTLLLVRVAGFEPFGKKEVRALTSRRPDLRRAWRSSLGGRILSLGVLEAFLGAFVPSMLLVVVMLAVGIALGTVVTGGPDRAAAARRVLAAAAGATGVALVLLAPWSVALLAGPDRWSALTGVARDPALSAGWGGLLRFAVGSTPHTPLAFGLVAAAGLPLLIAKQWRLEWAVRFWSISLLAFLCAFACGRGWTGPITVPPEVLLAAAGVGVAFALGLGVAAFESDLPGYRFGWPHVASGLAGLAVVAGCLPFLSTIPGGRFGVPTFGYGQALAWMGPASNGPTVLWLGDPSALPGGSWPLGDGLAYAVTDGSAPDAVNLWPGSSPGPAAGLAADVHLALEDRTVDLGHLLAHTGVSDVVVVSALAPSVPGLQAPPVFPGTGPLDAALSSQDDLEQIPGEGGYEVFSVQSAAHPSATGSVAEKAPLPGPSLLWWSLGECALWVASLCALVGRRRWLDWWWYPLSERLGRVPVAPATRRSGHIR